jgi:hypothetical protein
MELFVPFHGNWWVMSSLVKTFQSEAPRSLIKVFLDLKADKRAI